MASPRVGKVAERIQQILSTRLQKGIRDPRLGFVTITDVRVTGDLQHASVFYTVYGTDEERADSAAALKAATGMLRSEVGRGLGIRLTPTIEFILDELPESAEQISALLDEAKRRDAEAAELAKNANYAGGADAYRSSGETENVTTEDDESISQE